MQRLKNIFTVLTVIVSAVFATSAITVQPASAATVTCNTVSAQFPNSGLKTTYPNDAGNHFWVCFSGATQNNVVQMVNAIQNYTVYTRNILQSNNVKFYYFASRGDANTYFSQQGWPSIFQTTTARCGNTAYITGTNVAVASAIYNTCSYQSGSSGPNPNLVNVTNHEAGHSFDFSLALESAHPTQPMSATPGFETQYEGQTSRSGESDLQSMDTPRTGQSTRSPCQIFGYSAPGNPLEWDVMHYKPGGGTTNAVNQAVCSGGTTVNSPFVGEKNAAIAQQQEPYFFPTSGALGELWAEEFAIASNRNTGVSPLPDIDHIIGSGAVACTYLVVETYMNKGVPPTTTALQQAYCPVTTFN